MKVFDKSLLISSIGLVALCMVSCSTQRTASTATHTNDNIASVRTHHATATSTTHASHANETSARSSSTKSLTEKYCKLLNTEPQAISNTKLLAFIDRWYGIPYLYAGHDRNGIDCSSFACALYNDVYRTNLSGTSGELYRACAHVKRDQLQQGDLVFFKIYHHRVSHVGVYVANGYFVHASTKAGVVLSNLSEDYYRKRYCGGGKPTAAR